MRLLAEISEGSLGLSDQYEQLGEQYELRKSARAILLNEHGVAATQYLKTYDFHKLPGGGVERGESVENALLREVSEEVGCRCEILAPVGMVLEYRNKYRLMHVSICFSAHVVGDIGEPTLEPEEIEEGQTTLWLPPEEILARMRADEPKKFEGHFILKREICFLEEYVRSL